MKVRCAVQARIQDVKVLIHGRRLSSNPMMDVAGVWVSASPSCARLRMRLDAAMWQRIAKSTCRIRGIKAASRDGAQRIFKHRLSQVHYFFTSTSYISSTDWRWYCMEPCKARELQPCCLRRVAGLISHTMHGHSLSYFAQLALCMLLSDSFGPCIAETLLDLVFR